MRSLAKGEKIGGYIVTRQIGTTKYTQTYVVTDKKENKQYFLKLYVLNDTPTALKPYGHIREFECCKVLGYHANIYKYITDGKAEIDDEPVKYMVTQLSSGTLLSTYCSEHILSAEEILSIITGIIRAVLYVHGKGYWHLDINPSNIILEGNEESGFTPKLFDFEHAVLSNNSQPLYTDGLSLMYSYDNVFSARPSELSDTFSVAAVLYFMLTGEEPWHNFKLEMVHRVSWKEAAQFLVNYRATTHLTFADDDIDWIDPQKIRMRQILDQTLRSVQPLKDFAEMLLLNSPEYLNDINKDIEAEKQEGIPEVVVSNTQYGKNTNEHDMKVDVQFNKRTRGGGFNDVAGLDDLKKLMHDRLIWVMRDKKKAEKYRITPPNGMLLYGPPGCGKTYFAEKLAEETHMYYVMISGSDLGSSYIHETEGKIADLFDEAEKRAPAIICIDELDAMLSERSNGAGASKSYNSEVNEFLVQLNNCSKRGIFVIGTTNRKDMLDPAVLRKGRLDIHYEIKAPDHATRMKMFEYYLKDRPVGSDIDYNALAEQTANYSAADISYIVNEAALAAALADKDICHKHLVDAVKNSTSSLSSRRPIGFHN